MYVILNSDTFHEGMRLVLYNNLMWILIPVMSVIVIIYQHLLHVIKELFAP